MRSPGSTDFFVFCGGMFPLSISRICFAWQKQEVKLFQCPIGTRLRTMTSLTSTGQPVSQSAVRKAQQEITWSSGLQLLHFPDLSHMLSPDWFSKLPSSSSGRVCLGFFVHPCHVTPAEVTFSERTVVNTSSSSLFSAGTQKQVCLMYNSATLLQVHVLLTVHTY